MKKLRFKVLLTAAMAVALLAPVGTPVFAQGPDHTNGVSDLHNPPEGEPLHGPPTVIVSMGNPQGPPSNLPPGAAPPGPPIMVEPHDPACTWWLPYPDNMYYVTCTPWDWGWGTCLIFPDEDYIPWGSYIFCRRTSYADTILCQTYLPTCYPVEWPYP
jgi:hypothetical protein